MADEIDVITDKDINFLWNTNPEILKILQESTCLEDARENLYEHLNLCEKEVFSSDNDLHPLEKSNIRECVRVFRSIIGPINEKRTQFSAIDVLWRLARGEMDKINANISKGFILEFVHLFRGIIGNSGMYYSDDRSTNGFLNSSRKEEERQQLNAPVSLIKWLTRLMMQ